MTDGQSGTVSSSVIHRFCITHERPLIPESWYDTCISLGDFDPDSEFHVRQLDVYWHEARSISYGAAGSYVLPIAIGRIAPDAQYIEYSAYRKRILPAPVGIQSPAYIVMREMTVGNAEMEAELATFVPSADLGFLIARPVILHDMIIGNYARNHHLIDLLDYVSGAIELGVLDSNSALEFLTMTHFVTGGVELGIYPREWLVRVISALEAVGRNFLNRCGDRIRGYDRYQVRAIGFLSERLGSYLLLRHLTEKFENNIPDEVFGYLTTVVEPDVGYASGLT